MKLGGDLSYECSHVVVEFIANNPGDWVLHCHMFHHMMNHMTSQVGPIIRQKENDPGFNVPGYPQIMKGMSSMKMVGMNHGDMKMKSDG